MTIDALCVKDGFAVRRRRLDATTRLRLADDGAPTAFGIGLLGRGRSVYVPNDCRVDLRSRACSEVY